MAIAKPYKCKECGQKFKRIKALTKHQVIHVTKKKLKKRKNLSDASLPRVSSDDSEQKCIPNGSIKSESEWQQTSQNKKLLHACGECGSIFAKLSSLRQHMFSHSSSKSFQCQFCECKYSFPSSLMRHTIQKHGDKEKAYNCTVCKGGFCHYLNFKKLTQRGNSHSTSEDLNRQLNTELVCSACKRKYKSLYTLSNHVEKHFVLGDIIQNPNAKHVEVLAHEYYKCSVCKRKYNTKKNLICHFLLMHTSIKSVYCNVCRGRYYMQEDFDKHMNMHSARHISLPTPFPQLNEFHTNDVVTNGIKTELDYHPVSYNTASAFLKPEMLSTGYVYPLESHPSDFNSNLTNLLRQTSCLPCVKQENTDTLQPMNESPMVSPLRADFNLLSESSNNCILSNKPVNAILGFHNGNLSTTEAEVVLGTSDNCQSLMDSCRPSSNSNIIPQPHYHTSEHQSVEKSLLLSKVNGIVTSNKFLAKSMKKLSCKNSTICKEVCDALVSFGKSVHIDQDSSQCSSICSRLGIQLENMPICALPTNSDCVSVFDTSTNKPKKSCLHSYPAVVLENINPIHDHQTPPAKAELKVSEGVRMFDKITNQPKKSCLRSSPAVVLDNINPIHDHHTPPAEAELKVSEGVRMFDTSTNKPKKNRLHSSPAVVLDNINPIHDHHIPPAETELKVSEGIESDKRCVISEICQTSKSTLLTNGLVEKDSSYILCDINTREICDSDGQTLILGSGKLSKTTDLCKLEGSTVNHDNHASKSNSQDSTQILRSKSGFVAKYPDISHEINGNNISKSVKARPQQISKNKPVKRLKEKKGASEKVKWLKNISNEFDDKSRLNMSLVILLDDVCHYYPALRDNSCVSVQSDGIKVENTICQGMMPNDSSNGQVFVVQHEDKAKVRNSKICDFHQGSIPVDPAYDGALVYPTMEVKASESVKDMTDIKLPAHDASDADDGMGDALKVNNCTSEEVGPTKEGVLVEPHNASGADDGMGDALKVNNCTSEEVGPTKEGVLVEPHNASGADDGMGDALKVNNCTSEEVGPTKEGVLVDPHDTDDGMGDALKVNNCTSEEVGPTKEGVLVDPHDVFDAGDSAGNTLKGENCNSNECNQTEESKSCMTMISSSGREESVSSSSKKQEALQGCKWSLVLNDIVHLFPELQTCPTIKLDDSLNEIR